MFRKIPALSKRDIAFFTLRFDVDTETGCWNWTGYITPRHQRAQFWLDAEKRYICASRIAWTIYRGRFDVSLLVCHHCDNPKCVNPDHLFLGTQAENMQDCKRKGRISPPPRSDRRGEKAGTAKLTTRQALAIKRRLDAGELGYKLAAEFGISTAQISRIRNGTRWAHI